MSTQESSSSCLPLAVGGVATCLIIATIGYGLWSASHPAEPPLTGMVDAKTVSVSAKIAGRLSDVVVREGDTVKPGDVVAHIAIPELSAKADQAKALERAAQAKADLADAGARPQQIMAAKADLARAQAGLALAQKTWARIDSLYKEGLIPAQKRDEVRAQLKNAAELVEAAKAQLSALEEGARIQEKEAAQALASQAKSGVAEVESLVRERDVASPVAGEVTRIVMEAGEIAPAGFPLVLVTDLSDSWVTFNVREDDLSRFKKGEKVKVTVPALDNRELELTVYWINPRGDYATWRSTRQTSGYDLRTFEVRARPSAPVADLRPGMTVVFNR